MTEKELKKFTIGLIESKEKIKENQVLWPVPFWVSVPNENPFSYEGGFLFVLFIFQYSSFIIH